MNEESLYYMLPLGMFLLMIATKSYKKSISNAISIVGLLFFGYMMQHSLEIAFLGLAISVFSMQIRAIVNHHEDSFLKR